MRALSVKPPWAAGIAFAGKRVENRRKPFPSTVELPAWVALHSSKGYDHAGFAEMLPLTVDSPLPPHTLLLGSSNDPDTQMAAGQPRGHLLGIMRITGCHPSTSCIGRDDEGQLVNCSKWAQINTEDERGLWHWEIDQVRLLDETIPVRGALGLWRVPDEHVEALNSLIPEEVPDGK